MVAKQNKTPKITRLKQLRQQRGLTLRQLSEAVGISNPAISQIENGTHDPSLSKALKLAKFFNVRPEDLLREVNP